MYSQTTAMFFLNCITSYIKFCALPCDRTRGRFIHKILAQTTLQPSSSWYIYAQIISICFSTLSSSYVKFHMISLSKSRDVFNQTVLTKKKKKRDSKLIFVPCNQFGETFIHNVVAYSYQKQSEIKQKANPLVIYAYRKFINIIFHSIYLPHKFVYYSFDKSLDLSMSYRKNEELHCYLLSDMLQNLIRNTSYKAATKCKI